MHIYRQYPESRLSAFGTRLYQWHGSVCHHYGREVQDISGLLAVFVERRQGRVGPYAIFRSVTMN